MSKLPPHTLELIRVLHAHDFRAIANIVTTTRLELEGKIKPGLLAVVNISQSEELGPHTYAQFIPPTYQRDKGSHGVMFYGDIYSATLNPITGTFNFDYHLEPIKNLYVEYFASKFGFVWKREMDSQEYDGILRHLYRMQGENDVEIPEISPKLWE